jgi:multidrug efflux pump subunit AcrB
MLTRIALRNPVAILMVSVAVIVLGWVSVNRIPVDLFPDITIPVVMVGVVYPGAGPKDIEASVTQQLERAVSSVPNVSYIESVSRPGISIIRAYFNWGADVDVGASDAIQRVQQVMSSLPVGARAPFVVKMDLSNIAVVGLTVSGGDLDERALYDLAYNVIQPQIERLDGVATASVSGGLIRQIQVEADRDALAARGLSANEVVDAISKSNFLLPSGNLRIGDVDYNVFAETQIREVERIRDLVVRSGDGGNSPIHIRDVADVVDGSEDLTNLVRVNGIPGVNLWVRKQPGSNTLEVVDRVIAAIPELRGIPAGVAVDRAFDQSTYIRNSIKSLVNEALLGALFAVAVIFFFLRTLRATAVITLAIPLSILATFILLYFVGGQSLNTFTLGGLALGVGRLVDDSIVVLENIFRHRSRGSSARQAALEGTREVAMPVLASTVATIAVFFPVIFLAGIAKLLFIPLTLTIVFALLTSYAVAMAVIPPLSMRFVPPDATPGVVASGRMGRMKESWRRGFEWIEGLYVRSLRWGLGHRLIVLGIILVLFTASMAWIPRLGTEFFPATDESQFSVSLRAPIGTRVEATANDVAVIEKAVVDALGSGYITSVVTDAGVRSSSGGAMWSRNTGPHAANVRVRLVSPEERPFTDRQAVERVRKALDGKLPGSRVFFDTGGIVRRILNFGSEAPLDVEITGYDLDDARDVYTRVRELVESVPGAVDVRVSQEDDYPELQVRLDHQKIAALGVSPRDVAQTMLTSVAGNINIPGIFNDPTTGREYWIVVRLAEQDRASLDDLRTSPSPWTGA